jgi:hypothetical protein
VFYFFFEINQIFRFKPTVVVARPDHVFSFIRSVYFSGRSNFPELENLTYLLSGVAEPSEIIKNKDVSPFNIGEKIYLDDFSFEEKSIKENNQPKIQ